MRDPQFIRTSQPIPLDTEHVRADRGMRVFFTLMSLLMSAIAAIQAIGDNPVDAALFIGMSVKWALLAIAWAPRVER